MLTRTMKIMLGARSLPSGKPPVMLSELGLKSDMLSE